MAPRRIGCGPTCVACTNIVEGPSPDLLKDAPSLFERRVRVWKAIWRDSKRFGGSGPFLKMNEKHGPALGVCSWPLGAHSPRPWRHIERCLAEHGTRRHRHWTQCRGHGGCRIRGPFALGEDAVLRMGTLVHGPTTVGQSCKVGGELSNVVVHDFSNKAHGGFLGNSVLGSWCNLGLRPHAAT